MSNYCFSIHALSMAQERDISHEWIRKTIENPDYTELREDGTMHYIAAIPERKGKFLRVIINSSVQPQRIITVFFDRRVQK